MKVAIFLMSMVAVAMAAPSGVVPLAYNALYPLSYGYARPAGGFAYSISTGSGAQLATAPAQTYQINYPQQQWYNYAHHPASAAFYHHPAPAATYYNQAPSVTSNQYHAQDVAGQYSYGYATGDGQAKIEQKTADGQVAGKFSYMDPEGKLVETRYTAGKDGFKAEGDHLPKPVETPEVPEEVKKAMDKAMDEFEEAKNRKGPEPVAPIHQASQVYTVPAAQAALPLTYYSSGMNVPFWNTYSGKSQYAYTG